jgi:hypothetical protein
MIVVPAAICGLEDEVAARCVGAADLLFADDPVTDVDLDELPELFVVLSGPAPLLAGEPHVHPWLPSAVLGRDGGTADSRAFGGMLESFWGVVGLIAVSNQAWLAPPERHRPFLAAVSRHRDGLIALDGRYTIGLTTGTALGELPTNISYALANLGVDASRLRARSTRDLLDLASGVDDDSRKP